MIKWFRCPDGQIIPVKDCLTKCRMDERCLTLPTLKLISTEREHTWICPNCKKAVKKELEDELSRLRTQYGIGIS